MAEGRIPAGGVHEIGVLVEGGMRLGNTEVVGRPVDFGDGGFWEALPDFSGSRDANAMEAEFTCGFLMLAFRVSDLSVGGSRC